MTSSPPSPGLIDFGIDPLTASSEVLLDNDLPLRPDPDQFPTLHKFWERMYSPPLKIRLIEFSSERTNVGETVRGQRESRIGRATRRQSSLNWSGSYIKPRNGKVFKEIHGRWRVPTVERSEPPAVSFPDRDYECSTWIGLDGQRSYLHSSLPQVGTTQRIERDEINGGWLEPEYFAWWQWWDPIGDENGRPNNLVRIKDFEVHPDDVIMCSLFVQSDTSVKIIIRNETTNEFRPPFIEIAPTRQLKEDGPFEFTTDGQVTFRVSGATAQWITERPSVFPAIDGPFPILLGEAPSEEAENEEPLTKLEDKRHNFPNYDYVNFDDCVAVQTEPSGVSPEERDLTGARLINMREVRHNPQRTAKISTPSNPIRARDQKPDESIFRTSYRTSQQ